MDFILQPVTSIHLHSNEADEITENGNANSVLYLTLLAVVILVIAWINYINLVTARCMDRGREVGIRKYSEVLKRNSSANFFSSQLCSNLQLP